MSANTVIKHVQTRGVSLRKVSDSAPSVVAMATPSVDAVTGPFVREGLGRNSLVSLRVTFRAMIRQARQVTPPRKGATVSTPDGTGTVTGLSTWGGKALVKMDSGSVLGTTYGCWYAFGQLTVTGFDGDAMVWYANGVRRASDVPTV